MRLADDTRAGERITSTHHTLVLSDLCLLGAGSFVLTGVRFSRSLPTSSHATMGVLWKGGGGEVMSASSGDLSKEVAVLVAVVLEGSGSFGELCKEVAVLVAVVLEGSGSFGEL